MKLFGRNIISSVICKALVALQMITLAACDSFIYNDLALCDEGLRLRFVYDYNMEFANAFPSQVDCLTLLVYDKDGNYIETRTETAAEMLSDENWRMTLDLPAGTYRLLAYGGMACADASFAFEVTVPEESTSYTEATVKMMKDTNNVRIVLQHADGSTVDNTDFTFAVTADNTGFDWNNDVIPTAVTSYCPWTRGQAVAGIDVDSGKEVEVAFAEFSTSRFMAGTGPRLEIRRAADGSEVLSIPLVNYLLLLKSQEFAWMGSQEFLDRESRWNMIFFLDRGNNWLKTQIVINGWVVRINDTEL